jgi:ketosteroid isomerase-like protein
MKKSILVLMLVMVMATGSAFAQGRGGRGGGLPAPPTLTGPVADMVNAIVTAINSQDTAYLQKVLAPDAIWADEDIHFLPATFFLNRMMQAKPAKKLTMTNLTGQAWDSGAWAGFRYTLDETTAAGEPNQMKGSITMVFKKAGNDWQVTMIHAPVDGKAITPH